MPISILIFLLIIILILIICSIVVNSINIPNYNIKEGGKRKVYGGVYTELEAILTELKGMGNLNKEEIIDHLTIKFEELKDKYRAKIEQCQIDLSECHENLTELHKNTKQEESFKLEMVKRLDRSEKLATKYADFERKYNSILTQSIMDSHDIDGLIINYEKLKKEHGILENKMSELIKGKQHTNRANRSTNSDINSMSIDSIDDNRSTNSDINSMSIDSIDDNRSNNSVDFVINASDNVVNASKMQHMDNTNRPVVNNQPPKLEYPYFSNKPPNAKNPAVYNLQTLIDQLQTDKENLNKQNDLLKEQIGKKDEEYDRRSTEKNQKYVQEIKEYKTLIQKQEEGNKAQYKNLEVEHQKAIGVHLDKSEEDMHNMQKENEAAYTRIRNRIKELENTLSELDNIQASYIRLISKQQTINDNKIKDINKLVNKLIAQL